jgi:hypothetical protein
MTPTTALRGTFAAFAAAATLLAVETVARADEREACASAADQAQQLRDDGKYRRAREQLLVCARDLCPAPIKRDCLEWLSSLEAIAPTIVLGAKEGTKDLADVKVSVDGVPVTEKLDGKPMQMDLGKHTFKFEYAGQTKEEDFIIGAGQKNRNVSVTFAVPTAVVAPTVPREQPSEGSLVPAIVVGGIGVVALGSFAIFGLGGKSDVDDLQSCKGHCTEESVDKARTKLIIADISLGVGIVALGVATYMFISRPKVDAGVKTGRLSFDFGPTTGGAVGSVGARF